MRICFYNTKGGAGKTSTALGLGAALARKGRRVLLIDSDPQGHLGLAFGAKPTEFGLPALLKSSERNAKKKLSARDVIEETSVDGLHLIQGSAELIGLRAKLDERHGRESILSRLIQPIADDYDDILIDSPGDEGIYSTMAIYASRAILIPTALSRLELSQVDRAIDKLADMAEAFDGTRDWDAFVVINRFDARTGKTNLDGLSELENLLGDTGLELFGDGGLVLQSRIRDATEVKLAQKEQRSVFDAPKRHPVCKDYESLASELLERYPQ